MNAKAATYGAPNYPFQVYIRPPKNAMFLSSTHYNIPFIKKVTFHEKGTISEN